MHLLMVLLALALAWGLRLLWSAPTGSWQQRWQQTLCTFLLPPLLLLTTAIAILCMGPRGQMVRWWEGWGSYGLAIGFLGLAIILGLKLAWESQRSLQQVRRCPQISVQGQPGRLIESPLPFIAQVGFWQPELVISQPLLDTLDSAHLTAALVHEQAHRTYRDTFWFFWFGWFRRLTAWLPRTSELWQELLMLRELRADQQAAQQVDGLLLAEALLLVVSTPLMQPDSLYAAFGSETHRDRLSERIDALLAPVPLERSQLWRWSWLLLSTLPLLLIPFHT